MSSGVDRIIQKILEEGKKEAEKIIEEAREKAKSTKAQKVSRADKMKAELAREVDKEIEEIKKRMLAVAKLEMRKKLLAVKQEMIDRAFDAVLDALREMPAEEYRKVISDMLVDAAVSGDEEVIISSRDSMRLDQHFLDEVNKRMKQQGKKGELKFSNAPGNFESGFILRSENFEINNSFDSILRMVRDEIEPRVAELLFTEQ